jgi:hypothetical protein
VSCEPLSYSTIMVSPSVIASETIYKKPCPFSFFTEKRKTALTSGTLTMCLGVSRTEMA